MRRRIMMNSIDNSWEKYVVDLGLPSGTLWATGNLSKDANENYFIADYSEYGAYFSWGNIDGHRVNRQNDSYSFDSSTYNSTPGARIVSSISGNPLYDAARAKLGGKWRMPTKEECTELKNYTTFRIGIVNNSRTYFIVTSSVNGNELYFRFASQYNGTSIGGNHGQYWTADISDASNAWKIYLADNGSEDIFVQTNYRYYGFPIRPVIRI